MLKEQHVLPRPLQEMTRQWHAEKGLLDRVHRLKEELERVKIEAAAAVCRPFPNIRSLYLLVNAGRASSQLPEVSD